MLAGTCSSGLGVVPPVKVDAKDEDEDEDEDEDGCDTSLSPSNELPRTVHDGLGSEDSDGALSERCIFIGERCC